MKIEVMYHDKDMPKLENIEDENVSVMIDLYTSEDYELEVGKFYTLDLGVSIKVPNGMQGTLVPRSSTFKKYGILQTNGIGSIDTTYCGKNDVWGMPIFIPMFQDDILDIMSQFNEALRIGEQDNSKWFTFRTVKIPKHTRLCQFEVRPTMGLLDIEEKDLSSEENRGGFGHTGD